MIANRSVPAFLFDLLTDKLSTVSISTFWRGERLWKQRAVRLVCRHIHRRIGMSGGLLVNALLRETGRAVAWAEINRIQQLHGEAYGRLAKQVRVLPGARELLSYLTEAGVPGPSRQAGVSPMRGQRSTFSVSAQDVTVITRDQVQYAKPDPDLFVAAADRLGVELENALVVGDDLWDMLAARRARALGVGLLRRLWRRSTRTRRSLSCL